jgi:hypothetical protein
MSSFRPIRLLAVALVAGLSFTAVAVTPSVASASTPPGSYVLSAKAAAKLGFPVVEAPPRPNANTGEAHCSTSVQALYVSTSHQVGLASETLLCSTVAAATTVFNQTKKQITTDPSLPVPKALGSSAIATAADAPQYSVLWRHGNKLGVTAIDTDVPASASGEETSTPPVPPTAAQARQLDAAALAQNALLSK